MLLDDVATYIAAQSTAFTVGGNLRKVVGLDDAVSAPNTLTVLYETAGIQNTYSFSTGNPVNVDYEQPRLQVLSRSTKYTTARSRAQTIYTMLDGYSGTLPTATGPNYLSISAVQAPFSVGRDKNDRHVVSVNFAIMKAVG